MILNKVNMIILLEKKFEEAVDFYKKLGLPLKFHLEGRWAEFGLGDIKLGVCPTDTKIDNIRTGLVIEVEDMAQSFAEMKKLGVEFIREPSEATHGIMASFKDPGGNILDLYQSTPEKIKEILEKAKEE